MKKEIDNTKIIVHVYLVAQSCPVFVTPWTEAIRLFCPWDSVGKNTGVSCHALLQGSFLTPGWNPHLLCLLHCRQVLYHQWELQYCTFNNDRLCRQEIKKEMLEIRYTLDQMYLTDTYRKFSLTTYTFSSTMHILPACAWNILQNKLQDYRSQNNSKQIQED